MILAGNQLVQNFRQLLTAKISNRLHTELQTEADIQHKLHGATLHTLITQYLFLSLIFK